MCKRYRIIALTILLLVSLKGFSQDKSFDRFDVEPSIFMVQLEGYMKASNSKSAKDVYELFLEKWTKGSFNAIQKDSIISVCTGLLNRRLRVNPEFEDFLMSCYYFTTQKHASKNFEPWIKSINYLLKINNRQITNFLAFSVDLYKSNALNVSNSNTWFLKDNSFQFAFDSVPKIYANNATLSCFSRDNYSRIINTSGVIDPVNKTWKGYGGRVSWSRVELDSTKVYANLRDYSLNLTTFQYEADSVDFFFIDYFGNTPIPGSFTDKLTVNKGPDDDRYPKFTSYKNNYFIQNIFDKIDYRGGFSMSGNTFNGSGSNNALAEVTIYYQGKLVVRAFSEAFVITKDKLASEKVETTFYFALQDSIYHPQAELTYIKEEDKVTIFRGREGVAGTPFYDSYHKITLDAEVLTWDRKANDATFGMIASRTERSTFIESEFYYKEYLWRKVEGITDISPLIILKDFVGNRTTNVVITIEDYANQYKLSPEQVLDKLRSLVRLGYILLNEKKGLITILPKTANWVKFHNGKMDYNILKLVSSSKNINGILHLDNYELDLRGVDQFFMSDSQSVYVIPDGGNLTILQNMDMRFDGQVHAGLFDFYGSEFLFSYENFNIDLNKVDSMKFKVRKEVNGANELIEVQSVVEDLRGKIQVDKADNKSGLKSYPELPIFESLKDSYVYYDKRNRQGSVYDRKRFYFTVYPFTIDSLDIVNAASDLIFQGKMFTDGIFPEFEEKLILRPDSSLGYLTKTPEPGFPNYQGKGTYYNEIDLSNKGYYGNGRLEYLSSYQLSKKFLFFLDSMNTTPDTLVIQKNELYPSLNTARSYTHWIPYADTMFLYDKARKFSMYNDEVKHHGQLFYTPLELTGNGKSEFIEAIHKSEYISFKPDLFTSDTADFEIKADSSRNFALESKNCNSEVDFLKRQGTFKPNEDADLVSFPLNQYQTSLNYFIWYFDDKKIDFTPNPKNNADENFLVSTDPKKEGLKFEVEKLTYDLKTYQLFAEGVPKIFVADAEISPKDGKVNIDDKGDVSRLNEALILTDTLDNYFNLYNASVNIEGAKKYTANAYYDYTDRNQAKQKVYFSDIKVDTAGHSIGRGYINPTSNFLLNEKILFYGDALFLSTRPFLEFDGFAKLNTSNTFIKPEFFTFKNIINPDTVLIPVDSIMRSPNGLRISNAYAISAINNNGYGNFGTVLSDGNDHLLQSIKGYMMYDFEDKMYKVGYKDKLFGDTLVGNFTSFDDTTNILYFEGNLDLGVEFKEKFKFQTAGQGKYDLKNKSLISNCIITLDFPFQKDAYRQFMVQAKGNTMGSEGPRIDTLGFYKNLWELMPANSAKKAVQAIRLFGSYKNDGDLNQKLVFSNVNLKWDESTRSYKSVGRFALLSVEDDEIIKYVNGYIQIIRKSGEDIVNVYFELGDASTWFFFTYRGGVVEAISSDTIFNDLLESKSKRKDPYTISTPKKKVDFIREVLE